MNIRRKDFTDSQIMDVLDANDYDIKQAASSLGIATTTLRRWIIQSENLSTYHRLKIAEGAVKAREKLEYMLEHLDCLDPKSSGTVLGVCKTLMDKYEPDLSKVESKNEISVDKQLEDKIKKLLGE